jgi:hypothetical protein
MENILEVYKRPYDPKRPVICMDESPKQLISEIKEPIKGKPGSVEKYDYEVSVRPTTLSGGILGVFL